MGRMADSLGHLPNDRIENLRIVFGQFPELVVTDFRYFAFCFRDHPGAAFLLLRPFFGEQAELAKELSGLEVGDDQLFSRAVVYQDAHRTIKDEKQGFALIAQTDDSAFCRITPTMAMGQKLFKDFVFRGESR